MQRKFHGFSYISSNLTTLPLIIIDSYFPASRTCESSYPTTLQFLSLLKSSDTTSNVSMKISVLAIELFVGLLGPKRGSELSDQNKSQYYWPFWQ